MQTRRAPDQVPRWIYAYAVLSALMLLFFGIAGYFIPSVQFPALLDTPAAEWPIGLYAARDLGVAAGLLSALYFGGSRLFLVCFIIRFVTDAQDLVLVLALEPVGTPLLGAGLLFLVLFVTEFLAIKTLWPRALRERDEG